MLCEMIMRLTRNHSCLQSHDHLGDDLPARRRTREHTEALIEAYNLGTLWDEYGIIGDIIVGVLPIRLRAI